ncbi:MAG TPA: ABC transporter permease [Gemmatimonadaceae bacterium]|nr:ABC transporter permease [Gemmatimonadaceae bacterium]
MNALLGLLRKEWYHILRDRRTLFVIIFYPVVQVMLFGSSIRTDVRDVRLAIVDPTPDATTLELRNRFTASSVFRIVSVTPTDASLAHLFQTDTAQVAVAFQPRFGERLSRGEAAQVLVFSDATEPNSGTSRQMYVKKVLQDYQREIGLSTGAIRIEPRVRSRFNPTRVSANLFVPGLMAVILTIIAALMTALSLTREKETGTMEVLLVSPLRPWQIIVGKIAPYLAIGLFGVLSVYSVARIVFGVPMHGSLILLIAEGMLFILVSLSIGILISARTTSQRVAMLAVVMITLLPTQMLSGVVFPIESMPRFLQFMSQFFPARWFIVIVRGVMLKGVGLAYLWQETVILGVMAVILLTASTRSFKVRLQ